jgi:hypothetical protein
MARASAAALVATALLIGTVPTATASGDDAHLSVGSMSPLTITGSSFHTRERVKVTVSGSGFTTRHRHVKATKAGRISVTFAQVNAAPCGHLAVTAFGAQGSEAKVSGTKHPDCTAG